MRIEGTTALVTGANRGVGRSFVEVLIERGAALVHAAARRPETLAPLVERFGARVRPLTLDLADPASIAAAAAAAPEIDLLVNNAGITHLGGVLDSEEVALDRLMAVNYRGPMLLSRAYGERLRSRGAKAGLVFVISMAALMPVAIAPVYSASKAAVMMMAHGLREELKPAGVAVSMAYPGFIDTDMGANFEAPKASPRQIAERALDGLLAGEAAIFPDRFAELTRESLETEMPRLLADPAAVVAGLIERFLADPAAGR